MLELIRKKADGFPGGRQLRGIPIRVVVEQTAPQITGIGQRSSLSGGAGWHRLKGSEERQVGLSCHVHLSGQPVNPDKCVERRKPGAIEIQIASLLRAEYSHNGAVECEAS